MGPDHREPAAPEGAGASAAPARGPARGLAARVAEEVAGLMGRAHADLAELVAIPSVADPRRYPPEGCRRAAEWVAAAFTEAGLSDVAPVLAPDGAGAVLGHLPPPPGAPTVLLYCHYDVRAPGDDGWHSPPFELTERGGRWYGRGAADCKGNIVMHLTALRALRALGEPPPVGLKLVAEGPRGRGSGGLERYVPDHIEQFRADALLVCDTGNAAAGLPTATTSLRGEVVLVVTVRTLAGEVHSGMFGGPAPDALAALIRTLDSLRDRDGGTAVQGLDSSGSWDGDPYDERRFRADAGVLEGVSLTGGGTVADRLWARPAVTVLGIDCPSVAGSAASLPPTAAARISLRIPPGADAGHALDALAHHLRAAVPWNAHLDIEPESLTAPFRAATGGPAYAALDRAAREVYGRPLAQRGQGGSIPLCEVLAETYPEAEIILMGVEEPRSLIHAPDESVDPAEIQRMAAVEALFLHGYPGG